MSEQGGIIETLGFEVKLEGTFENVEVVDGKLQLKKKTQNPITYHSQGTWTSRIIDIGDEFESYTKIIATIINDGSSSVGFSTRTSGDGLTFEDWRGVGVDNAILSTKKRYIQVKADMYVGMTDETVEISTVGLANEFVESVMYRAEESIVPILTSNTSSAEGVAFSSSNAGGAFLAWAAFDGKTTTYMRTSVGQNTGQVGFLFSNPKKVIKYTVSNYTPMSNIMATSWELQGSNDTTNGIDGTWTILDTKLSQVWGTVAETKEYDIPNNKEYKSYRLNLTGNTGGATIGIGELNFVSPPIENIQLKRNYNYDMTLDSTWSDSGSLHRKPITRNEWLKIDRLDVK